MGNAPMYVTAEDMNYETGEIRVPDRVHGRLPHDPRGTFIINGTERVVISQLDYVPPARARSSRTARRTKEPSARRSSPPAAHGSSSRSTGATPWACASTASVSSR